MVANKESFVVFMLDARLYALAASEVVTIVRAVRVTPLQEDSAALCGMIDLHGRIIPVLNIHYQLNLPQREIRLGDRIVVVRTSQGRHWSFIADDVLDVIDLERDRVLSPRDIYPDLAEYLAGVGKFHGDPIIILDPDALFTGRPLPDISGDELSELVQAVGEHV